MYTYIKDHELFVLIPESGRVFKIKQFDHENLYIEVTEIMNYQKEVVDRIKETNATLVKD